MRSSESARSRLIAAAFVAVSLVATGCGSTVRVQGLPQGQASEDLGAPTGGDGSQTGTNGGLPSSTTGGTTGSTSGTSGTSSSSGGTGGPGGPGGTSGTTSGTGGTTGGSTGGSLGPATGRGYTRTTINIGVPEFDDPSPFVGALGVSGVTGGDPKAQMADVFNDINRRGGLAGRKIVAVYHKFEIAQYAADSSTANQAACVDWTQDHKVFAVLDPGAIIDDDGLFECMAKADTPLIIGGGLGVTTYFKSKYVKYPNLYNLAEFLPEQYVPLMMGRLVARGFFSPWDSSKGAPGTAALNPVRIGMLYEDTVDGRLNHQYRVAQLAKYGLKVYDDVGCPPSTQQSIACQQNAVLTMRADNVTHVMPGGLTFMRQAEKQQYRPRYSIELAPQTLAASMSGDEAQFAGSMMESWIPALDTAQAQSPGNPTPATDYCLKVMRAGGEDTTAYGTALWQMESICDFGYFLKAAVDANPLLTTAGLRAGFNSLGTKIPSALTFSTIVNAERHATAFAVRDLAWNIPGKYFYYVSKQNYTK